MRLQDILKKEREKQGLTKYKLAKSIDTSLTNYDKIESGVHSPSFGMLCRLSTVLGISITISPNEKIKAQ